MSYKTLDFPATLAALVGLVGQRVVVTASVPRDAETHLLAQLVGTLAPAAVDGVFDTMATDQPMVLGLKEVPARFFLAPDTFEAAWGSEGYLLIRQGGGAIEFFVVDEDEEPTGFGDWPT